MFLKNRRVRSSSHPSETTGVSSEAAWRGMGRWDPARGWHRLPRKAEAFVGELTGARVCVPIQGSGRVLKGRSEGFTGVTHAW